MHVAHKLSSSAFDCLFNKDYNLTLSYNIIKGFKPAKKCIKRYLRTHLVTSLYGITGEDWSYAAALPLQKFEGPQPW